MGAIGEHGHGAGEVFGAAWVGGRARTTWRRGRRMVVAHSEDGMCAAVVGGDLGLDVGDVIVWLAGGVWGLGDEAAEVFEAGLAAADEVGGRDDDALFGESF